MSNSAVAISSQTEEHTVTPKGPKTGLDVQLVLRIVLSLLKRRWLLFAATAVIGIMSGGVASMFLNETVWRGSALLLHTPPPIPDSLNEIKGSLSLQNVSGLLKSRPVTEKVRSNLNLGFPAHIIESSMEVETSRLGATIFISMDWKDQNEVTEILDEVTKAYPEYVAEIRRNIAQSRLKEAEVSMGEIVAKLETARQRLVDFSRKHNIVSFKDDLTLALAAVESLRTQIKRSERDETSYHDQIKMLDKQLQSIKKEQSDEAEAAKKFEAAAESLADNRRRQNRLRELIEEERRMIEVNALLKVKQNELDRARKLAERDLIPRSKLETAQGEVDSLIAKITENKKIIKWKKELLDLDKLVVPKNNVVKKGSPIISQILFRKLEVQLEIAHGQKTRIELKQELDVKAGQIAKYQRLSSELTAMEDEIKAVTKERDKLAAANELLRQLATFGPIEFSTLSPASTGSSPVSSNKKKVFVGIAIAVMMICATMVAGFDVLCYGIVPLDAQVERLGLDVVARIPAINVGAQAQVTTNGDSNGSEFIDNQSEEIDSSEAIHLIESQPSRGRDLVEHQSRTTTLQTDPGATEGDELHEVVRSLALELRQRVRNRGSVILFGNLTTERPMAPTLLAVANCLAERDERVLLLDIRPNSSEELLEVIDISEGPWSGSREIDFEQIPGLYDWLEFGYQNLKDITWPTHWPGVDCMLAGQSRLIESLATIRMTEFMQEIRSRYSMAFVLTEDASSVTDLQIMASHADGILFQFGAGDRIKSVHRQSLTNLYQLNAPLIGSVHLV